MLDWLGVSNLRCFAFLAAISLAVFLPGFFTLQPMDRDEPRFAQATKQMLETGDFVSIRFQDEARNKKPVGIYWLQAAFVATGEALGVADAREQIWLYRLPSLFGAIGAVLATFWAALAFVPRRSALLAGALLASTLLLGVEAHLAKTDAVLCATVVLAMGVLARLYLNRSLKFRHALMFWGAMALGILIKGPIAPIVPLLAVCVLGFREGSVRWLAPLRPLMGLGIILAVAAPWFVLIAIKTQGAFFSDAVGGDMLSKVAGGQESHGAPPLTYFALFWVTAWPLAPLVLLATPAIWAARKSPAALFLLAWVIPSWIMFELVPTKLPHYVLPLYPALAILAAKYVSGAAASRGGYLPLAAAILMALVAVVIGGAALLLWANYFFAFIAAWAADTEAATGTIAWLAMALGCGAGVLFAIFSARALKAQNFELATFFGCFAAFSLSVAVYSGVLTTPAFLVAQISPRLAAIEDEAAKATTCGELAPFSTFFREPSLVFLTETNLKFGDGGEAAAFLSDSACRIAFVEMRDEPDFLRSLPANLPRDPIQRVRGVNLGNGKRLDIGVYVRQ